jgi:hypothetical protein
MENLFKDPHRLHKYGTILLWAGILVWAPFFILRGMGESPSLLVYLPFHLAGVVGGSRIRKTAKQRLGLPKPVSTWHKKVAHVLVIASLLIWIPYYAFKLSGQEVELTPYLTLHLIGIFSGTGLMAFGGIAKYFKRGSTE